MVGLGRFLYGERAGVEGWSKVNMFEQVKALVTWALHLWTDRQTRLKTLPSQLRWHAVTTLHCEGNGSNDNPHRWRAAASNKFDLVIVNRFNV